jgi:two-component system LytT family sensor kinase
MRAMRRFLTPTVFAICIVAWMSVAFFLWGRDLVLIGAEARSFSRDEVIGTVQSMLLWGLFSPFILVAAQWLEFERGRMLRALAIHVALAIALSTLDVSLDGVLALFTGIDDSTFGKRFYSELFINTFSYCAVAGIGYALVYQWRLAASREGALLLQRELAQARLDSLARTLQPHFLFNALNSVAALVRLEENKRALTAVVALSDLLRIVLKTRGEARVPLSEELEVAGRYVAVEQLRFEDRLQVQLAIEPGTENLPVPALILQPLIENAIRHGVETSGRGRVTIGAQTENEWLKLCVKVECLGDCPDSKVNGLGIGLDVTRRRLACLYGDERFSLDLFVGPGNSAMSLKIPREEAHVRADHHSHRR